MARPLIVKRGSLPSAAANPLRQRTPAHLSKSAIPKVPFGPPAYAGVLPDAHPGLTLRGNLVVLLFRVKSMSY